MSLITLKMLIFEGVVQHIWVESGRRLRGDVSIYGPSVYKDILWILHLNHECGQFMEDKNLLEKLVYQYLFSVCVSVHFIAGCFSGASTRMDT